MNSKAFRLTKSEATGMANFFHHVIALASLWFDPNDLIPVEASWAKHPDAKVPDTYRSARFISKRTGDVVLEGAVGKYMGESTKLIRLYGTCGRALLDREENTLIVINQNLSVDARCDRDTGYRGLVSALVNGKTLPSTLLTVEQALSILRLVEEAHSMAKQLPFYPDGQEIVFAEA